MHQASHQLVHQTGGQGLVDITAPVTGWVARQAMRTGLLTVFCRHTSASLLIGENADPSVGRDTERFFARLAPESTSYEHDAEGPDDMPAHLRSILTQTSLTIPLLDGALALGTWQGIFLFEHRRRPHRREIVLHLAGE